MYGSDEAGLEERDDAFVHGRHRGYVFAALLGNLALEDHRERLPGRKGEAERKGGEKEENPLRPAPILATHGKRSKNWPVRVSIRRSC